jgi:hypothetical protein
VNKSKDRRKSFIKPSLSGTLNTALNRNYMTNTLHEPMSTKNSIHLKSTLIVKAKPKRTTKLIKRYRDEQASLNFNSSKISKKNGNVLNTRSNKVMKKRHEIQNKYHANFDTLSTNHMRYSSANNTRNILSDKSRCRTTQKSINIDPTVSQYAGSMTGLYDFSTTPMRKSDMRKSILTSGKSKHIKPKTKTKHFKLFKKRNLNSKISKELKFGDFKQLTPSKPKIGRKYEF